MQNVLKRQQVTASLLCHAGQGQLHVQPFLDLDDPDDVQRMRRLAEELYQEVFAVRRHHRRRTRLRTEPHAVPRAGRPARCTTCFREVKRIFDPENILNPGKIVGDDPELLTRHPASGRMAAAAERAPPPRRAKSDPPQAARTWSNCN